MITITEYMEPYTDEIIALVLHCQNDDGASTGASTDYQPDLLQIREKYIMAGGNFWVALDGDKVVGSIALMNTGNGIGIMKKFFIYEQYRGLPEHLGQRLFATLLEFAKSHGFRTLVLDTPKTTDRAHKFYEKAGFKQISEEELPITYDYERMNFDFFRLDL